MAKRHPLRIVLSGGGTGGHVYPAIAIADELRERFPSAEFLFVGAKDRMEMTKVPEAGYPIVGLWISGIERKISLKNFLYVMLVSNKKNKSAFYHNQYLWQLLLACCFLYFLATLNFYPCCLYLYLQMHLGHLGNLYIEQNLMQDHWLNSTFFTQ